MSVGNETENRTWRGRIIRYAPFLFWASLIFIFSSSTGSAENTSRFIRPLLEFLFYSASPKTLDLAHLLVRKAAHFFFYGALGLLALRAFVGSSKYVLRSSPMISALIVTFAISVMDEFNQSLNPERTGSQMDVLLDMAGATTFLFVKWFTERLGFRVGR